MNYGERISQLRQNKRLTQKELAAKLYVADRTISSWEMGRTEPSLEMVVKLSEVLECNPSYIIYGDDFKDNIEMEIKVRLTKEEYNNLNKYMKAKGGLLLDSNQQDIYYQSNCMDNNKSLRIRTSGNKKILTYKDYSNKMYSEEYEVEVDNGDNLKKIFSFIGLKKIIEITKERKVYSYKNKYEVSIDKVEDLGYFIEIEVKDSIDDYSKEYDELIKEAKYIGLNLNNIEPKRYPQLMIEKTRG